MTERSVSDLVFRDFEPEVTASPSHDEREAALREALRSLRASERGPRVVPASRRDESSDRQG
jgi:hypothetical protein